MNDEEQAFSIYFDLPDDSEEAFAVLQMRKYEELELYWDQHPNAEGWFSERRFVDTLNTFDEVHNLNILTAYRNPPKPDNEFSNYFQDFRRHAEIASQKIMMEAARRHKTGAQSIIVLDANARQTIHALINAIKEKLNGLSLSENKRESLFGKLNAFAAEVDRNRTRPESFFAFAVEMARTSREVNDEIKPILQSIDRIVDWIEKAKKWVDVLHPWEDRKRIEGPTKRLPGPSDELDDEIPF